MPAVPLDWGPADERRSRLAEIVHDSFRAMVLSEGYPCVGAKSALRRDDYRFGLYPELGSADAARRLVRDLTAFVDDHERAPRERSGTEFTSFVASFRGPVVSGEAEFERLLWAQLEALHERDRREWDPSVDADPASPCFSFSVAGTAFFIIGLHAASSRRARRFAWPTLVFNPHEQFERLRAEGLMDGITETIRERERALQGTVNPMVQKFGERSEARQYSGRAVGDDWQCPFAAGAGSGREAESGHD